MELNSIPKSGTYADGVDRHNDNYSKINLELQTIRERGENSKGYFETLASLQSSFPSPQDGWQAFVSDSASSTGYYVAKVENGAWEVSAAEAPPIGVDLAGYARTGGSEKTVKEVEGEIAILAGVKPDRDEVIDATNKFDKAKRTSGQLIDPTTGNNNPNAGNWTTSLIKLSVKDKGYLAINILKNYVRGAFYSTPAIASYISGFSYPQLVAGIPVISDNGIIAIPEHEGDIYVNVSFPNAVSPDEVQIEINDHVSPYRNYGEIIGLEKKTDKTEVKKILTKIEQRDRYENKIIYKDVVNDSFLDVSGKIGASANHYITGLIPIAPGQSLHAKTGYYEGVYHGLYNTAGIPILGTFVMSATDGIASLTGTEESAFAQFTLRKTLATGVTENRDELLASSQGQELPDYEINNLKTTPRLHLMQNGKYGTPGAIYKIERHEQLFRVKFNFLIDGNVNSDGNDITLWRVDSHSGFIKKSNPSTKKEDAKQTMTLHYQQALHYASAVCMNTLSVKRDYPLYRPFIGHDAFMVWLKKDDDGRQAWLEEYQDLCVGINDNQLIIFRDGLAVDDSTHNNGLTSTILSIDLKSSGTAKEMSVFLRELENAIAGTPILEGVVTDFMFIEDHTTDDLLRFEKIKMVTRSNYQVTPPATDRADQYDSFPVFFPYWKDDSLHTCELLFDGQRLYSIVDGLILNRPVVPLANSTIYIGSSELSVSGLEVWRAGLGDAEIISASKIITEHTPYVLGLCGHGTYDQFDDAPSTHQSSARLLAVVEELRKKGYYIANVEEIYDWKLNNSTIPRRTAFIMLDDWNIPSIFDNVRNRNKMITSGAKINICQIQSRYENPSFTPDKDAMRRKIALMRSIGWSVVPHAYYHDVRYAWKTSIQLNEEIDKIKSTGDEMGENTAMLVLPFGVPLTNMQKMIQWKGIAMAIDTREINSTSGTWEMSISREALQSPNSIETVKEYII